MGKEKKISREDIAKMSREERMKYENAQQRGILDQVLEERQNTPPGILISKKKARSSTIWHSLILLILSRRTHSSDRQLARKESMRSRPTGFI